jgi:hypothetical protein
VDLGPEFDYRNLLGGVGGEVLCLLDLVRDDHRAVLNHPILEDFSTLFVRFPK